MIIKDEHITDYKCIEPDELKWWLKSEGATRLLFCYSCTAKYQTEMDERGLCVNPEFDIIKADALLEELLMYENTNWSFGWE